MFKINWKDPGHVMGVGSILATLILGIFPLLLSQEFRDLMAKSWGYWLLGIMVLLVLSWAISLRHENSLLKGKLTRSKYDRWERIKAIKYGHVMYRPFLDHDPVTHKPCGVGPRILEELLRDNGLVHYKDESSWGNMFNGLLSGEFDIIATPLFETRTRLKDVAFSRPIFFADIGIFVRKESFIGAIGLTHNKAVGYLKSIEATSKTKFIPGEISQKMIKKYLENIGTSEPLTTAKPLVHDLFDCLTDHSTDIVFAERFFARNISSVASGEVVNILKPKELLYPVGFAMRKQDYILRNYINIKLMELDDKHPKRLLGFIVEEVRKHVGFNWVNEDNASEYFVKEKNV